MKQAQARIVELLQEAGLIDGEIRPITHAVKFWENGTRPLEIVTSQQWFIRYPDKDVLLERGKELAWWPDFMHVRYENWVNGLVGDWNITRQRFFGVPFPVWYPIDADGVTDFLSPILADEGTLPIDPTTVSAPGYDEAQRNQPGGFAADPDVMDTWATSSLTPQIAAGWVDDPDLYERTFPMDLRPQAHDIIRTWLFSTVVRSQYEHGVAPWSNVAISGFIVDPDRKKLSKSAGNMPDSPPELIARHGADAVRYWAASGRPGMDAPLRRGPDEDRPAALDQAAQRLEVRARPRIHQRAASPPTRSTARCWPASPTWSTRPPPPSTGSTTPGPSSAPRRAFWSFCDDYLELVKNRAYSEGDGADVGQGRPRHGPRDLPQAVRAVPALRHRRGVVVVAGGQHPPLGVAHGRRAPGRRRRGRRPRRAHGRGRGARARSAGPSPRPSARCGPTSARSSSPTPPTASPPSPPPPTT